MISLGSTQIVEQDPLSFAFDADPALVDCAVNIQSIERDHTDSALKDCALVALLAHV